MRTRLLLTSCLWPLPSLEYSPAVLCARRRHMPCDAADEPACDERFEEGTNGSGNAVCRFCGDDCAPGAPLTQPTLNLTWVSTATATPCDAGTARAVPGPGPRTDCGGDGEACCLPEMPPCDSGLACTASPGDAGAICVGALLSPFCFICLALQPVCFTTRQACALVRVVPP